MKKIIMALFVLTAALPGFAQTRYYTKTGNVLFSAGTAIENIDAANKSANSVFDAATGQLEFAVLVKGFEFKSSLMQEHFNENYMESDKYPKAHFKGKIVDVSKVNFQKAGEYPATVAGTLTMHGVTKEIETKAVFKVSGEASVVSTTSFVVSLDDFNIAIPGLVKDKISKTAKIKVDCNYNILK
jgi:polyisoprenoid-binding protein YceI